MWNEKIISGIACTVYMTAVYFTLYKIYVEDIYGDDKYKEYFHSSYVLEFKARPSFTRNTT